MAYDKIKSPGEKDNEKNTAELNDLVSENEEKEKRASELIIANKELAFQNQEKEKRAAELIIANKELIFQNIEKEKRASELVIANKELIFQNIEKEKRASELIIANQELAFQNQEKEKLAAELIIANKELAFQIEEKEKAAAELIIANKELLAFSYVSSHDLQEPLRKIQTIASKLLEKENPNLSEKGKNYFRLLQEAANRMQILVTDLLSFSHLTTAVRKFENTDLSIIVEDVKTEFKESIEEKHAIIQAEELSCAHIIPFQFRQLMHNLIGNALKYSIPGKPPHIIIKAKIVNQAQLSHKSLAPGKDYCHISVSDNGIGFEPEFKDRIFEVFQKLHGKEEYEGTGIGLAIVKKIIDNHNGIITATGQLNNGATFDIYIPDH